LIVIFIDVIEDFVLFLEKRIMNEIFYEFKETKTKDDLSSELKIEITLHFLAKIEEYLALFETKISISKEIKDSSSDEDVFKALKNIFSQVDPALSLIKGKIREIFLSYSY